MDPLSLTASIIAVTTLAWQSSKATCDLVGTIKDAPSVISDSKHILTETLNTLAVLKNTAESTSETHVLDSILQTISLQGLIESTTGVCEEFNQAITAATTHSTGLELSKRDRLAVGFREAKFARLNQRLGDCQRTVSGAVVSIILFISCRTLEQVRRFDQRFVTQEAALAELQAHLETSLSLDGPSSETEQQRLPGESEAQLDAKLRKVCAETLSATRARHAGQTFGNMTLTDNSHGFQGVVGTAQSGLEQKFGKLNAGGGSKAVQGQLDAASFAVMFGGKP